MKRTLSAALLLAATLFAQRPLDWPSRNNDARRTNWERSDYRITRDNAKDFQLLYKRKFDGPLPGPQSVAPPTIIGLLISYKGFKELGFFAGNTGDLWSIDVDLNKPFWHRKFDAPGKGLPPACQGLSTHTTLIPPAVFSRRPGQAAPAQPARRLGGAGFGGVRPVYTVTADGKLQQINTADGSDLFPALPFLPAGAKPSNLLMANNMMYAYAAAPCAGDSEPALYAINMAVEEAPISKFATPGALAGEFAVGNDGTVYVQTDKSLIALNGRDLSLKATFVLPGSGKHAIAPTAFDFKGTETVAVASHDGRVHIFDAKNLTAPLASSPVLTSDKATIRGGFTTWEDAEGNRFLTVPVWGAPNSALKSTATSGAATNGAIVTLKIEDQNGKLALTPIWTSRDLKSPVPPVTTSGVVFALSTAGKGVLYAFDAATGKELYTSGTQVHAPASLAGMTLANGRLFFTTTDNTMYAFGIFMEI
jgi:outer membrane protein assembly factor BamB